MSVSFGGMGDIIATFKTSGTVKAGNPVKMQGNGTVQACSDGDRFCGIALAVADDGYATVQLGGYVKAVYSGSDFSLGYAHALADGDGKLKADAGEESTVVTSDEDTVSVTEYTGGEILVIDIDTTAKIVGFIL